MSVQNKPTVNLAAMARNAPIISRGSVSSAAKTVISKAKAFFRYGPNLPAGTRAGYAPLALPTGFGLAGRGARAIGFLKKMGTYVGIGKPQTAKQILKNIATFGGAYAAGTYAATGKLPEPSLRTLAGYAGAQANLPATLFGGIHGLATEGAGKITDLLKKNQTLPYTMSPEYFKQLASMYGQQPAINFSGMGVPSTNITMPSTNISLPSYSPSLSVGGGQSASDYLPLLLLLLGGAGAAGYVAGRKRKKKKYKKRRRR